MKVEKFHAKKNSALFLLLVSLTFLSLGSFAQSGEDAPGSKGGGKDMQFWQNVYLEKFFNQWFSLHLNQVNRITNNLTQFRYSYADIGASYKINKHLHIVLDYVLVEKKDQHGFYNSTHQFYVAATYKQKIGSFMFNDRQMVQLEHSQWFTSDKGKIADYYLRNKLTVKFRELGKYTPYVAEELYYKINQPFGQQFDRIRCFAGIFYEPNNLNEWEAYYAYEKHFNVNAPKTNFVLGIGYAHNFY
jgi:hypothetical protein